MYALFTAGMVYFGVLQQVLAGEYSISTATVTLIWYVNGLAIIALDAMDIRTVLGT